MSFDSTIHAKAVELAKLSYQMTAASGSGHPTTATSLVHLIAVLMYQHMRYEPTNPSHPSSDRLVLSEGHAVPVVYAACSDLAVAIGTDPNQRRAMTREDAMTLRQIDSPIEGHPNPIEGFPFFDTATGSLGQGLSHAAGLALAARADGIDRRCFCIIGDGESREGQVWEAVDFIAELGLGSVCAVFNCNQFSQSEPVGSQQSAETIAAKLQAADFQVIDLNGHNPTAIQEAYIAHARAQHDPNAAPVAIVARTIKGWGTPSQQGVGHHGKVVQGEELESVLKELEQTGHGLGASADMPLKIGMMSVRKSVPIEVTPIPTFVEAIEQFGMTATLETGRMATRKAYGVGARALGRANGRVMALDCDVKNSTGADQYAQDDQIASRFFECHIAEQNMISMAAGLAVAGKIPFCSTFGKFVTRAYDQIEIAVNSGANIKIVGSHAGVSLAADGPSQMALSDVAWFRAFSTMRLPNGSPGFYILQPSDAYQCYALVQAMAEYDGPCYLRTLRPETEFLYSEKDLFHLGGHEVLNSGRDLLIIAAGYMVHEANKALQRLDDEGIDATLVDLYSIPFDTEAILDLANQNNGMVLTLEDNYGGGLGSAIADAAAADGDGFTVTQMHVRRLPKSGLSPDDLMHYCGLSAEHIVAQAMAMLQLSVS